MDGTGHRHPGGRPVDGAAAAGLPVRSCQAGVAARAMPALLLALWTGLGTGMCPLTVLAQSRPDPALVTSTMVTKIVAGIMSFTRWPHAAPSIRLCTVGSGPGVDALQKGAELGSPGRTVSVVPTASLAAAEQGCDAVYLGRSSAADARQAVRVFAGRPVLMLGEGSEFCSDGGMFCLEPATQAPRFGVNLDAVARSGLRVNPQVLRIARGGEGQGS